jgi:hypothetical protein
MEEYGLLLQEGRNLEVSWLKSGKLEDADQEFIDNKLKFYETVSFKRSSLSIAYILDVNILASGQSQFLAIQNRIQHLDYLLLDWSYYIDSDIISIKSTLGIPGNDFIDNTSTQIYNKIKRNIEEPPVAGYVHSMHLRKV